MIAVLTADIINSRRTEPKVWLNALKKELRKIGDTPKQWEIYKGDYFQVEIANPLDALTTAIKIKAALKSIKDIDVRIAIGIGEKEYSAKRISESNGPAFIFSGETFEKLKKEKINIVIKSNWPQLDKGINFYLQLGLIAMDRWPVSSAEIVKITMENPTLSQEQLGRRIGIKQNAVSNRLKTAYYDEIVKLIEMYKMELTKFL